MYGGNGPGSDQDGACRSDLGDAEGSRAGVCDHVPVHPVQRGDPADSLYDHQNKRSAESAGKGKSLAGRMACIKNSLWGTGYGRSGLRKGEILWMRKC